jgi:hypothetical protein
VDFRRQSEVEDWIASHSPRIIILTAGRVHLTRSKRSHA